MVLKPGVHLIVTIAVIVQKQSIPVTAERSPSHVHSILPVVQKTSKVLFFGAKSKSAWNEPVLQCTLGNMVIVLIAYDRWPVSIWLFWSFTIVTIAEAITAIEPDYIPGITIAGIFMIIGIVNSDVSTWLLWSLTDVSAIVMIVTIKWTPGFTHNWDRMDVSQKKFFDVSWKLS